MAPRDPPSWSNRGLPVPFRVELRLILSAALLSTGLVWITTSHQGALALPPDNPSAISLHPVNPRYFLFRGKPLVLITATEHYGSVINRAFDFGKYLDDAADKK